MAGAIRIYCDSSQRIRRVSHFKLFQAGLSGYLRTKTGSRVRMRVGTSTSRTHDESDDVDVDDNDSDVQHPMSSIWPLSLGCLGANCLAR